MGCSFCKNKKDLGDYTPLETDKKDKKPLTLDDIIMKQEIGDGAYGLVKLAWDKQNSKLVAVK